MRPGELRYHLRAIGELCACMGAIGLAVGIALGGSMLAFDIGWRLA
jgi:hypothetical protein